MSLSALNRSGLYYIQCYGMLFAYADKKLTELQDKYPNYKRDIQTLADNEPIKSKQNKYLNWGVKVLVSNKAKPKEIIDVLILFDKFQNKLDKKDINAYKVEEFTDLRDKLFELGQHKSETKVREEEKTGAVKLLDNDKYLLLRPDTQAATCYYGKGTKWCITMKDKPYYDEHVASNVVFYILINKTLPPEDTKSKIAFAVIRNSSNEILKIEFYDAADNQLYESEVPSDIKDLVYSNAIKVPKSVSAKIQDNEISEEEVLANINKQEVQTYLINAISLSRQIDQISKFKTPYVINALQQEILKTNNADNAYGFVLEFLYDGADLPGLSNVIIRSNSAEKALHFMRLMQSIEPSMSEGVNKKALERVVMNSKEIHILEAYIKKSDVIDIKTIQEGIINSGSPLLAYELAKNVNNRFKGVDIRSLEDVVIRAQSPLYIYEFAKNIPGADEKALEQAIIDSGKKDPRYLYFFAKYIKNADVIALRKALAKLYGNYDEIWLGRLDAYIKNGH